MFSCAGGHGSVVQLTGRMQVGLNEVRAYSAVPQNKDGLTASWWRQKMKWIERPNRAILFIFGLFTSRWYGNSWQDICTTEKPTIIPKQDPQDRMPYAIRIGTACCATEGLMAELARRGADEVAVDKVMMEPWKSSGHAKRPSPAWNRSPTSYQF
jgi:hypothetical protein